jgi:hypothetical protein
MDILRCSYSKIALSRAVSANSDATRIMSISIHPIGAVIITIIISLFTLADANRDKAAFEQEQRSYPLILFIINVGTMVQKTMWRGSLNLRLCTFLFCD